jgi:signal transduction histidine kinase
MITIMASTALVLLAVLAPLGLLVRTVADDNAKSRAVMELTALAPVMSLGTTTQLRALLDQYTATGDRITVFLPDGSRIGTAAAVTDAVRQAREDRTTRMVRTTEGLTITRPVNVARRGVYVAQAHVPRSALTAGVTRSWIIIGLLGLALLSIVVFVADRLARSFLRPILAVVTTSTQLAKGNLDARVDPSGAPEIRDVGRSLNLLAERIGGLVTTEREAVADLSHRLRTPLTALQLDSESLREPEERHRLLGDVDELRRTVDDIIRTSRRPTTNPGDQHCNAVSVVEERTRFWSVLAEEQARTFAVGVPPRETIVAVAASELAAALDALLGNVLSHTPDGTGFTVTVTSSKDGGCDLVVSDAGPGIDHGAAMVRGTSSVGSTGLGLDIVRRTAESSGGNLRIGQSPYGGAEITVHLGPPRGSVIGQRTTHRLAGFPQRIPYPRGFR